MADKVFFDTNILLYCYSIDEKEKQEVALNLIDSCSENSKISIQVINELSNILFKKFKLSSGDIENTILEIDNYFEIVIFDIKTQIKALKIKEKYKFQFYDSLIIATALESNCTILYSEDMQHGFEIENALTIINPFKAKINE
jgi:predicted nucleic acid-binding protein